MCCFAVVTQDAPVITRTEWKWRTDVLPAATRHRMPAAVLPDPIASLSKRHETTTFVFQSSEMADLPSNVHVSSHPCVRAKISQLRSQSATARQVRELVHEISLIVGCDALGHSLSVQETNEVVIGSLE